MTQVSTTVLSSGTAVRGYSVDGVFTAASALTEWMAWILYSPNNSVTSFYFPLKNEFPMELGVFSGLLPPMKDWLLQFKDSNNQVICEFNIYTKTRENQKYSLNSNIIPPGTTLFISTDVALPQYLMLTARRIALLPNAFDIVRGIENV